MIPFVYLASPFEKTRDRDAAVRDVTHAADALMGAGFAVFAPIVQYAQLRRESAGARERKYEDWLTLDIATLDRADALVVLCIEGWDESVGIRMEMAHASASGIPIVMWRQGDSVFTVARTLVGGARIRMTIREQLADVTTRLNRLQGQQAQVDD